MVRRLPYLAGRVEHDSAAGAFHHEETTTMIDPHSTQYRMAVRRALAPLLGKAIVDDPPQPGATLVPPAASRFFVQARSDSILSFGDRVAE